jgi:Fe-S cluster biogenesis protein NfuA
VVRADGGGPLSIGFLARILGPRGGAEPPEPGGDPVRIAEVEAVLAGVRPALSADGGDVHLLEVTEAGLVRLRFVGACERCHQSPYTTQALLAPRLREALSWVREVVVR